MIKVCTYNVNSIRTRKELLLMWLEKEKVNILCLQEIKTEEKNFPFLDLSALGYKCYIKGQKAYNGVAICSKMAIDDVIYKTGVEILDKESRIIAVKVKDTWIINTYFPHGDLRGTEKFYYKLNFYSAFLEFIRSHFKTEDKIILLGDMNVALGDIDVFDPVLLKDTIGTMPEERKALKDVLNWGFIDAFRFLYPNKVQYTWWDYIGGMVWKDKGMRIDYILITKPLTSVLKDVYVDMWARKRKSPKPSDHAPVIGVFDSLLS